MTTIPFLPIVHYIYSGKYQSKGEKLLTPFHWLMIRNGYQVKVGNSDFTSGSIELTIEDYFNIDGEFINLPQLFDTVELAMSGTLDETQAQAEPKRASTFAQDTPIYSQGTSTYSQSPSIYPHDSPTYSQSLSTYPQDTPFYQEEFLLGQAGGLIDPQAEARHPQDSSFDQ
ncbi:unnamed protein product [Rotaria sp. Silwood2]|nr:unnamed protein product [Rotaria sp. Silwood2]CAF2876649.1 unnamed protein product [Rotaria sp. Silwood2]CAF3088097.1 unnamed protein product [Rotaria sp. Silwood2]CAF3255511.1 unnamed protein product [Rotaria sp. Silwood2]CAF4314591.1 unnamed protein product [Rotaria sp. Silwood2]